MLSPWAVEEVAQAWETGIVPADLDLGKITLRRFPRGAFARLVVETAALCRGTDTAELLAEYGLEAESVAEESPFCRYGGSLCGAGCPNGPGAGQQLGQL